MKKKDTLKPAILTLKSRSLTLPRRSAGHKMTVKVPLASQEQRMSDIRTLITENAEKFETINYIYVLGKTGKLKGVINIKDVFLRDPEEIAKKVMTKKLVKAHVDTHQERAAHLALKNNIKAVPLVNEKDKLLGVVSSDAILSIIDHESKDDLLKISGIIMGKNKLYTGDVVDSPIHSYIHRAPWIVIGMIAGLFTVNVITSFETTLAENLILASFLPLVAYTANAIGNQTQTLYIRNLATQPRFPMLPYAIKQYLVSALISFTVLVTLTGISALVWDGPYIGFVVGVSIFLAAMSSTTFALLIPRVLDYFDADPATGSGPFSTVIQDFVSILLYLLTASTLI